MQAQSDMAWRRRVLQEEAVMERGLTQSALLASSGRSSAVTARVGTWGRKKGYSTNSYKDSNRREGQIHPIEHHPIPTVKSRLGSRAASAHHSALVTRAQTPAAVVRAIHNLTGTFP
jgi:hypothetical protein